MGRLSLCHEMRRGDAFIAMGLMSNKTIDLKRNKLEFKLMTEQELGRDDDDYWQML